MFRQSGIYYHKIIYSYFLVLFVLRKCCWSLNVYQVRRKDFFLLSTVTKLLKEFIPKLSHEADGLIFQVLKSTYTELLLVLVLYWTCSWGVDFLHHLRCFQIIWHVCFDCYVEKFTVEVVSNLYLCLLLCCREVELVAQPLACYCKWHVYG